MARTDLQPLWTASVVDGRTRLSDFEVIRCFLRRDGGGPPRLLVQIDESLVEATPDGVVERKERLVHPLRTATGETAWLEADGGRLRLIEAETTLWEHDFERRRFGVGVGRDHDDDLVWGRERLGFYREEARVAAIETIDLDGDGADEIVVVLRDGRVLVLDQRGSLRWTTRLKRGAVISAQVFVVDTEERGRGEAAILICAKYRQVRKRFFWFDLYEPYTFLLRRGRVLDSRYKLRVIAPAPGHPGVFVTEDTTPVRISRGKLSVASGASRASFGMRRADLLLLSCPWQPDRGLVLEVDLPHHRAVAKTLANGELWERDLPPTEAYRYEMIGTVGATAEAGGSAIALRFATKRTIGEGIAEVSVPHVWVLSLDGKLIAELDLPPNGEFKEVAIPVLVDGWQERGRAVVLVGANAIGAFAIPERATGAHAGIPEFSERLPEYPLPPSDLWSADWLGTSASGEAERSAS